MLKGKIDAYFEPFRAKRKELAARPDTVENIFIDIYIASIFLLLLLLFITLSRNALYIYLPIGTTLIPSIHSLSTLVA